MEVKAKAKYIRTSPRKVRLVVDVIRGMDVKEALIQLDFIKKAAVKPVKKLLDSAIANAVNNFKLDKNNLYIAKITADDGSTLRRWKPRAFGRAAPIRKRSTHIAIVLEEKVLTKAEKKVESPKRAHPGKEGVKKKLEIVSEKPKETLEKLEQMPAEQKVPETEEGKPEIFDETRKGKHRDTQHEDKRQMKKGGRSFVKRIFSRKSGM